MARCFLVLPFAVLALACDPGPVQPPFEPSSRSVQILGRVEASDVALQAVPWFTWACLVEAASRPCGQPTMTDENGRFRTSLHVPVSEEAGSVEVWAQTAVEGALVTRHLRFDDVRFTLVGYSDLPPDTLFAVFTDETGYTGN